MNENIHKYLKQLLADSGEENIPSEVENQMIEDLNVRLEERLVLVAADNLSPEKQEELATMAENDESSKKIEAFVKENIPDWDAVFSQALMDFREVYLGAQE